MIMKKDKNNFPEILQKSCATFTDKIINQQSHEAMIAADVILLASGTATLEAMLITGDGSCYRYVAFDLFYCKRLTFDQNTLLHC